MAPRGDRDRPPRAGCVLSSRTEQKDHFSVNINTRTPRTSRAPRGRGWSGSSGGPVPASSGPGSSRRTCARCSGPARRGPRPAARRVAARRRALQDTRGRQGGEEGQAQARRRPGGGGPGDRQRPRGVAPNDKVKVAVRMGYGFRNVDNLISLLMLRCSDIKPALPGRQAA